MAILAAYDAALAEVARVHGYGYTALSASYETYDRHLFEDTLNDWQWCGDGEAPTWYTGEPWSA